MNSRNRRTLIAEILITIAALIALYLFYEFVITNLVSSSQSDRLAQEFSKKLTPENIKITYATNETIGLVYIPKLRDQVWGLPVIEGVEAEQVDRGFGHYPGGSLPGTVGNYAIAGHRATHGEPFAEFEKLAVEDRVFLSTPQGWFEYVLEQDKKVSANETWVLDPEKFKQHGVLLAGVSHITLTTCDPRWNSTRRWVWFGSLVAVYPPGTGPISLATR